MSERYLKETLGRLPQAPVATVVETLPEIWTGPSTGLAATPRAREPNERSPAAAGLLGIRVVAVPS